MIQNNKIIFICSLIYVIAIKTIFMQHVPNEMPSISIRLAPSPGSPLSLLPPQKAPMLNQQSSAAAAVAVNPKQPLSSSSIVSFAKHVQGIPPTTIPGQSKIVVPIAKRPQPLRPMPGKSQPLAANAGQPQSPATISGQMQSQAVISTPKPKLPHTPSKMLLQSQASTPVLKQLKPPLPGHLQQPNSVLEIPPATSLPQQFKPPNPILQQLTPKPGSSQLANQNLGKSQLPILQQSQAPLTPQLQISTPKPGYLLQSALVPGQSPAIISGQPQPSVQPPKQPPTLPSGQPQLIVLPSGQLAALLPGQPQPSGQPSPPQLLLLINEPKLSTPSPGLLPQHDLESQKLQLLASRNMSNQTIPPKTVPVTALPNLQTQISSTAIPMKPQPVAPSQGTSAIQAPMSEIKPSSAIGTIQPAQSIVNQPQMLASSSNASVLSPTSIAAPPLSLPPPSLTTLQQPSALQQTPSPLQIPPELIQKYLIKLAELQASKEQNTTLNTTVDHFPKMPQTAPIMNQTSKPINQKNELLINQPNAPPLNQQNILTINQAEAPVINQGNALTISQPNASQNPLSSPNNIKSVQDKLPSARGTNLIKSDQLGSSPPTINQQNALSINETNVAQNQPKTTKNQLLIPDKTKPVQNKFSSGNAVNSATSPKINQLKAIQSQPSLIKSTSTNIPLALSQQIASKPPTPQKINLPSLQQQAQPNIQPNILQNQLSPNLLAAIQKPALFSPLEMTTSKPKLPTVNSASLQQPVIGQSIIQVLPSKLAQLDQFCGVPSTSVIQTRIVGGTEAKLKSWPWMAAIFLKGRFDYVACAGALITNQFILTAAHCIIDADTKKMRNISEYTVRLGEHDFSRSDDGASPVDLKVLRLISYPEYDPIHKQGDIGLIQLSNVVTFTDSIIPVCLPTTPEVINTTFYKQRADISGWGFTSYGTYSNHVLRNATVRVTQLWKCKAIYLQFNYTIDDSQICAGNNKIPVDVCQGDSGGPMVFKDAKMRMNIIGVISYGVRCAQEGFPGVYTKVSHYLPWIKQNANIS